jgi:hypothetical protein
MPFPKNQVARKRGEYPGEAGADWGYGATARPEADEHYAGKVSGLRGQDKQEVALRDQSSNMREPIARDPIETQRSLHQDGQSGAAVQGNPPMVQGSSVADSMPEGLQRERKGPYDRDVGRNEAATQVPNNGNPKR